MTTFQGIHGPWLMAEIGGNHEGDFHAAIRLADLAIASGVDAVKFQVYFGDTLVSSVESPDRNAHFRRFELSPRQHLELAERVLNAGLAYVASVWDLSAFTWIDPVITAYKVGSGDLTAPPFLRAASATGKPVILSTGLSEMAEVLAAVDVIRATDPIYREPSHLAVLQCTSMYPIPTTDANLSVMESFSSLGATIGYSDHTPGTRALEIAAAMGADVLEFHFTDHKHGRPFRDHQLSLDPADVRSLIRSLDELRELKGDSAKRPLDIEVANGHPASFRRAVYPARDIATGELLGSTNLCLLRPNHGIDARDYDKLIGKHARRKLSKHHRIDWCDIE